MERAFGHDFSSVMIHEGGRARALGAVAYTQGQDIHFAEGRYAPDQRSGLAILGHELAHVVQQASGRVPMPQGGGSPIQEHTGLEREADVLGSKAALGVPAVPGAPGPSLPAGSSTSAVQPAPPIQRTKGEAMELEEDDLGALKGHIGTAMQNVITKHTPTTFGNQLDVLSTMSGYRGMHEGPDSIKSNIQDTTRSPYTHNSAHLFSNLAQSYVFGVSSYKPNDKDSISVTNHLKGMKGVVSDKNILSLVSKPTFKSFREGFDASVAKKDETADTARNQLWSVSQLLDLESARRRAGGVMNAGLISHQLRQGKPDARGTLAEDNVMSHEGASGKSGDASAGKFERLDKSRDAMRALLSGEAHPELQKSMQDFINKVQTHDSFKRAQADWKKAANIRRTDKSGMIMNLGTSRALEDNEHLANLKGMDEFGALTTSFKRFMKDYYKNGAASGAAGPAHPRDEAAEKSLSKSHFLPWLINKSASQGHQQVLDKAQALHSAPEAPAQEFRDMFKANEDPDTASKLAHVANLRRAYTLTKNEELFGGFRLHANNPAQHLEPDFGKYVNLENEVTQPIRGLYEGPIRGLGEQSPKDIPRKVKSRKERQARKKADKVVMRFINTPSAIGARNRRQQLEDEHKSYAEQFSETEKNLLKKYKVTRLTANALDRLPASIRGEKAPTSKDEVLERIKALEGFTAVEPSKIKTAIRNLSGFGRVYNSIETDRDPTAGAVNELVRTEGQTSEGKPLSPTELLNDYNIMSPEHVNSDSSVKDAQYTQLRENVRFKGPMTSAFAQFKEDKDEDALRGTLESTLKRQLTRKRTRESS